MNTTSISRQRLLTELEAMTRRYPAMRLLTLEVGATTFEGTVVIDDNEHCVRLTLPPGYPSIPPELREIEAPGGAVRMPAGALYRLDGGSICLFPHGNDPQAWHRGRLAVEALDKFAALVPVDRARAEGRGGLLFREPRDVFVPAEVAALLRWPHGRGTLHLRRAASGEGDLFADGAEVDGETVARMGVLGAAWSTVLPKELRVPWSQLRLAGRQWEQVAANREKLDTVLAADLPAAVFDRLRREEWVVLVRAEEEQLLDSRGLDAVLIRRSPGHLQALHIAHLTIAHPQERLFHRVDGAMQGRDRLEEVRVVLIGLGSLGGTVARALAQAGLRRFVLIDPDRLSVDNICRHVGTIRDIGRHKVEVIKEMLEAINPEIEVTTIAKWLAWDLPWLGAGVEVERMLAEKERTVVLMTCAAHLAERQLNAQAVAQGVTVIYAAALGAAEHGRIFRVIPRETPCYECILAAQNAAPTSFPRFSGDDIQGERVPYLQPGLPGLSLDITQIAMLTGRFTLQTIARLEGIDLGLADESGDHLLWTNRGGWIFDRPLQLMIERIPRSPNCATCGDGDEHAPLTETDEAALQHLLVELGRVGD